MKKIILWFIFISLFFGFSFSQNSCITDLWVDQACCSENPEFIWCTEDVDSCETEFWVDVSCCKYYPNAEWCDDQINCINNDWIVLKDWTCCPDWSYPYDPSWLFWWWEQYTKCCNWILYDDDKKCCEQWVWIRKADWDECLSCDTEEARNLPDYQKYCSEDTSNCDSNKVYQDEEWLTRCCPWILVDDQENPGQKTCIINTEWSMWINMNKDCLINWQCSYNIYKTLGIRKSDQTPKVSTFVQDIVLGITMFLGTAITIILIISGILYILAAILGKSNLADMAKKWIFNSILWLVLVSWSYAIVRLVQFVATAGGW